MRDLFLIHDAVGLGDVNGDGRDDVGVFAQVDLCEVEECESPLWAAFGQPDASSYDLDYRLPRRPGGSLRAQVRVDSGRRAGFYYAGCDCTVESATPLGDRDGDGRGEVLTTVRELVSDTLAVTLLGGRSATSMVYRPGPRREPLIPRLSFLAALGDVDGDGAPDLAAPGAGLVVHLDRKLRRRGDTVLNEPPNRTIDYVTASGDIDGDELADVQLAYDNGSSAIVYGARDRNAIDLAFDAQRVMRVH